VVVKRLSAIEDLGSIEVLCSDKTGTLTENKLSVADVFGDDKDHVLLYGALATSLKYENEKPSQHAFDYALLEALPRSQKSQFHSFTRVMELPFDPLRKRNSISLVRGTDKELVVMGAAETIFPALVKGSGADITAAKKWIADEGIKGRRTVAVAYKKIAHPGSYEVEEEESGLHFVGLVSFVDPIKKSTKKAVQNAGKLERSPQTWGNCCDGAAKFFQHGKYIKR
jgi:P-type E1-E2 ATPase